MKNLTEFNINLDLNIDVKLSKLKDIIDDAIKIALGLMDKKERSKKFKKIKKQLTWICK